MGVRARAASPERAEVDGTLSGPTVVVLLVNFVPAEPTR